MIDIHFHCLPGIDDGPQGWNEAVELCQAAASEGTRVLVATPHVLREGWINDDPSVRDQLILKLNTFLGGRPSVLAGCEYLFSTDVLELLDRGRRCPLTCLNRSRYLLMEFAPGPLPIGVSGIFHELAMLHVTPVLAHPERNPPLASAPEKLEELVQRGALVQITAGSLLGDFGSAPMEAAEEFFARGLVHLVASDAHSLKLRPPRLAAARAWVRKTWGSQAERGLFEANPQALLRSEAVPWQPSPPERMRR